MILLDSTSVINLISGSNGEVDVVASFVDINQATNAVLVQAPKLSHILTAATTPIVLAPSSGFIRNVKNITVTNESATANLLEIEINNGYGARLIRVALASGESLVMGEDGQWNYYAANGALQTPSQTPIVEYGISGCLAETMPRNIIPSTNNSALASGTLFLQAIYLRAGTTVSNISFCSATSAGATITSQIFGLYDDGRNLLATTANDGATAWAANTLKTLNLTAPYTVTQSGLYYLGIMVTATTVPTMAGSAIISNATLHGIAPTLHGQSTTGLTTALPNPAAAITVGTTSIWGCVK